MSNDATPAQPQRLQVAIATRHIVMLDRLAVDIRLRHGTPISRTAILHAIVEAAERNEWAAELFQV
jgi:hypothetical protein